MDIGLLHKMCKEDTRNAFSEFKRVLSVELFPYNDNIKNDLQIQLTQAIFIAVCNLEINNLTPLNAKVYFGF